MLPEIMLTIRQAQLIARDRLMAAGIETPELDARLIIQHVLGLTHEAMIADPHRAIGQLDDASINSYIGRRLQHEPVSRIIGEREFYGRAFVITPDVLDPRPDTETLIEQALDIARVMTNDRKPLRVLDVGTGSGAIIATLLAELADVAGTAADVSAAALDVARLNTQRLAPGRCVEFVQTRWLEGIAGPFDIVVSNPPYIATQDIVALAPDVAGHDPMIALDGGVDGLDAYRAILPAAFGKLAPGGFTCVEVGAEQADAVANLMRDAGYAACDTVPGVRMDLAGRPRAVTGRKHKISTATQ